VLGNLNADNTIIEVCNPYCGPCAKAHKEIDKLLENNNNLKVQLLFNATNEPGDKLAAPVKHLLAINAKGDAFETRRALDEWWQAEKKDYEVFADKYKMNGEINRQGEKIEAMNNWCKAMEITFTPTIFINGYQLPELYGIDDLKYFY
jgi:protein-disulfide isomerase